MKSTSYTIFRYFQIIAIFTVITSCSYKSLIYQIPDEKDITRFKHEEVGNSDFCWNFTESIKNKNWTISNWTTKEILCRDNLSDVLTQLKAKHFLVIKNDTIVFEYLGNKMNNKLPRPIFSMAKTFISAALGKAIEEEYIDSTSQLVSYYLPELNYHENFNSLTIDHLLNQTSGLKLDVKNISDAYYSKVTNVLKNLHFKAIPGSHFEYININSVLLSLIVERATKQDLHKYFSDHIWSQIGTCDPTVWGYDYKTQHTRGFCCVGVSARDLGKFGKLYLNLGKWLGNQILDSAWVQKSTSSMDVFGNVDGYNNNWFIGDSSIGDFLTLGMHKQLLYVNPKEKVIIVSFMNSNKSTSHVLWWELMRQISNQA